MGREQKTNKEGKKTALLSQKEKKAQKKAKKENKSKIVSDLQRKIDLLMTKSVEPDIIGAIDQPVTKIKEKPAPSKLIWLAKTSISAPRARLRWK